MADNKKYYYLKLKDNFFDTDEMVVLESMADGHLYSNILLKLYLRSLKNEGRLMFNERIPFNSTILSQVTRHNVGVVEKALTIFRELGLIEVLDNGAIYLLDIQNFIGKSSTEADRKREYRTRITEEKQLGQLSCKQEDKCLDKPTPELELDIELKKDINIGKTIVPIGTSSPPKTDKYKIFFETYNKQEIVNHQKITQKMKQAINAALNKDSQEDILKAIERYGQAYNSGYKFAQFKMTLDKFLTQGNGYYDWLDEGQKWINYSDFKEKGATYAETTKQNEPENRQSDIAEQAGVLSF